MTGSLTPKDCLFCNKPLRGRLDKKFCDDACRNSFNNQKRLKTASGAYIRNINNTLLKNRNILERLISADSETAKTNLNKLQGLGFIFKYYTHTYTTQKGAVYHYCYDYGWLALENNWYLLVRRKEG
jgi:predicted nucleic acid-binding Zn ribbon protein